jgi:putative heme-binding domain-containing protein
MMPRVVERILGRRRMNPRPIVTLFRLLAEGKSPDYKAAGLCLAVLAAKVQSGEISGEQARALRERFAPKLRELLGPSANSPLRIDAAMLAVSLKEPMGLDVVRRCCQANGQPESVRLRALDALIAARDDGLLDVVAAILADRKGQSLAFRGQILGALGKLDDNRVAEVVLARYEHMEPDLQPLAIELLTQRPAWGKQLVRAIGAKKIPAGAVNVNQVRKLLASKDAELAAQVKAIWGTVREGRNPEREKVVKDMGNFLRNNRGDARVGALVFKNLCAQCHKIYGDGFDVGPDLTGNGRASFDQLLSNVFDPSLVIGAAYQATTVQTTKGRALTGLLVEDNARRVVLKLQGGKLETIPRGEIDEMSVSQVSLMPEGIEKQLKPKEIADLFAFLTLDKPPDDPAARPIPGTPWK